MPRTSLATIRYRAKRRLINDVIDACNRGEISPKDSYAKVARINDAYDKRAILMALSDHTGVPLNVLIARLQKQINSNLSRAIDNHARVDATAMRAVEGAAA